MADLELTLSWLDMSQYLDRFVEAGFDSWETVLEITENDLEVLDVDLGHRRKLQKEIANTKRLARDPAFVTPLYRNTNPQKLERSPSEAEEARQSTPAKRGYRHHPKPDPNAPERPYSAYVMFSNEVREYLKNENLSFTEISRQVGNRWQNLTPKEKEEWRQKTAAPWGKYKSDLAEYQKSSKYREHQLYQSEFKASQKTKSKQSKMSPGSQSSNAHTNTRLGSLSGSMHKEHSFATGIKQAHFQGQRRDLAPLPHSKSQEQSPKVPISRLRRESGHEGAVEDGRLPRNKHACESCRQKKTKCSGERPTCKQCMELDITCHYGDGKRDQDKQQLDTLTAKIGAYETLLYELIPQVDDDGQQAIQEALNTQLELGGNRKPFTDIPTEALRSDHSSEHGGESDVSGVGSMGSTNHANQQDFVDPVAEDNIGAFVGQSSESKWIRRLKDELQQSPPAQKTPTNHPQAEDMDTSVVGDQIDPFDLPPRGTTDALVNAYFVTVHPSFPVLDKRSFMTQYQRLITTMSLEAFEDRPFVSILQLVIAIGAVHAHLTRADWAGDVRDHLLYFTRARVLAIDAGIFNDVAYFGQVQAFGLGGLYLLITDQINRAYNIIGLAIRCAQSFGMHLKNTTPTISTAGKNSYAKAWFAIASLERQITVMTGRPSMINNRDCSVAMPRDSTEENSTSASEATSPNYSHMTTSMGHRTRASSSPLSDPAIGRFGSRPFERPRDQNASLYFIHYVQLSALAQDVVSSLYRPDIRQLKWSKIQTLIEDFDRMLCEWKKRLPESLSLSNSSKSQDAQSYRIALAILFHSTRTIINRPCLCRIDCRIIDQSTDSKNTAYNAANRCVESARTILDLTLIDPGSTVLRQSAMWWMLLHHIKRALTVLLLELAFRAEHMPSEAQGILAEAKKGINWLRFTSSTSITARRAWITMSRLLQLAAQKVGGNTSDIITAPSDQPYQQRQRQQQRGGPTAQSEAQDTSMGHMPPYSSDDQATGAWPPYDLHGGGFQPEGRNPGDLAAWNELDQLGFLPAEGMPNLFPTPSEIANMGAQGGLDHSMYEPGNDAAQWFGFQKGQQGR